MYMPVLTELARMLSVALTFLVMTGVSLSAASAQPVRIAVGAASVASLPTWVAQDGGYFAREGVPTELIYIRGGPQTMSALVSGEVPFAQIYGGALVAAGLTGADVVIIAGLINSPFFSIIPLMAIRSTTSSQTKWLSPPEASTATRLSLSQSSMAARIALPKL